MFHRVKESIRGLGDFSEQELSQVTGRLKWLKLKKGSCIISEGQVCQKFIYVDRGSFRHYKLLENGREAVLNLFVESDWVCEYKSFTTQKPAETIIQAAENSEIFELSVGDFHELVKTSDSFFRVGRIFEQAIQNQDYQNNRMSPEEKYELLLSTKPQIIQKFALKNIAS